MKNNRLSKLTISRTTIHSLQARQLQAVAGGTVNGVCIKATGGCPCGGTNTWTVCGVACG
jgi:hypothetical protein